MSEIISNKDETVQMFDNKLLNVLSKVHFSVPLFIYIPVILVFLYLSVFYYHVSALVIIGLIAVGVVTWTITEYLMHRFVFHWMPPGKLGAKINFIVHGVHHAYPRDSMRLVMVPTLSIPLGFFFYFAFRFLLGESLVAPFFVGLVSGYLFYDMTHYALHHANFRSKFWLELKQHHMVHHYTDPDNGFGVSTKFWDHVFRTTFKMTAREMMAKRKKDSASIATEPQPTEHVQ